MLVATVLKQKLFEWKFFLIEYLWNGDSFFVVKIKCAETKICN